MIPASTWAANCSKLAGMDNTVMLLGSVAAVWIIFVLLRAPATVLFFALLVGQLMAEQLGNEAYDLINQYATFNDIRYVYVGILLLPVILTLLVLRGKISKTKRIIEVLPLLFTAVAIMIFIDNYLSLSRNLPADQNNLLQTYEGVIVSAGAVLSLVSSWFSFPRSHKDKHKKH